MIHYLPSLLTGAVLVFLFLRFVYPELIYSLREALVKIGINKVLLDDEAEKPGNHNARYYKLLIKKLQYETAGESYDYAFDRVSKLRELYNTLSVQRDDLEGVHVKRNPQICIAELANLLNMQSKQLIPTKEYKSRTVKADSILRLIIEQVSEDQGAHAQLSDKEIEEWIMDHPIAIEQVIEIQIAAVLALAYRQKAEQPHPEAVTGSILTTRYLR